MRIRVKRAYEDPAVSDGTRVLVDRLWPRGVTKERARIDLWLKDIAPSPKLRTWFGHELSKWDEFKQQYQVELSLNSDGVRTLVDLIKNGQVTLVYGAKDRDHNQAVVLKEFLEQKLQH